MASTSRHNIQLAIEENKDAVFLIKKIRLLEAMAEEVQELKDKFKEKYGRDLDEDEDYDDDMAVCRTLTLDPLRPLLPEEKDGIRWECQVCSSQVALSFSESMKLCANCKTLKWRDKDVVRRCSGNPQLIDRCPVELLSRGGQLCVYCRLKKMSLLVPTYYAGANLVSTQRPTFTEEGHWGFLMDLSIINNDNFFILDGIEETASILVRIMKIDDTNGRELLTDIINVNINDTRLKSVNGIETFMLQESKTGHNKLGGKHENMLVFVDSELIPWSPMEFNLAVSSFHSMMVVDYLLNPHLNSHPLQQVQTRIVNSNVIGRFINLQCIESFMNKRGVTEGGWMETNTPGTPLVKDAKAGGTIYMYLFENGVVYIGSCSGSSARWHEVRCACVKCHYKRTNKSVRSVSAVLFHVQAKTVKEREVYEGMIQVIFKFAELYGLTLKDIRIPVELSKIQTNKNKTTWPDVDPNNLPQSSIQLINHLILLKNLSSSQYDEMQNFSRLLFNREFTFNWNLDTDYLKVPLSTPKLEVEDQRESRKRKKKN